MTARAAATGPWASRMARTIGHVVGRSFQVVGFASTALVLWVVSPLPLDLGGPLLLSEAPAPAVAIVCLGSGVYDGLPSSTGLRRIRTSVRLYQTGFAPVVIFSGGPVPGSGGRPAAEVYAEAARLLGLPAFASIAEPRAENTADHPRRLLEIDLVQKAGGRDAALLVVTTGYHGLRAARCFRRAGFSRTRVVTRLGPAGPELEQGAPQSFVQRTRVRLYALLAAIEEWTALGAYKVRGWI